MLTTLPEEVLLGHTLTPAADAAGRTGVYFSLKAGLFCWLVYYINQGNAATIALTPQQAKTVAGGSAKAIPAVPIWVIADAATSCVPVRQAADAVSYTTDATLKSKIVIFQIDPAALDIANAFVTIAGQTGASNAANITSAYGIASARYPGINTAVNPMVD